MKIERNDSIRLVLQNGESEAVRIAAENLRKDLMASMDVQVDDMASKVIKIKTGDDTLLREGFSIKCTGDELLISGADRRGTIYGIYTLSEMLGVSPWHFMADVPVIKRKEMEFKEGFELKDHPVIEYRGIFINDEEELDKWVSLHMGESTIGEKTYAFIFELLLRLKMNYIWPAMHVNSFNMKKENGALADRMGIVVGTSHCDMLMRSNNREWVPWLKSKGYEGAEYDFSVPGKNREILKEYWAESVEQNKDFEVSYTLGMRGIHDSGFEVRALAELKGKELLEAKTELLETVIETQEKIIADRVSKDPVRLFVPYKEVLELYDNGLNVPEDVTLVWVNDNYGYVRRYPNSEEKKRKGGNGLYYHNSYWAPPGNSYMFIDTIPLAHTANELKKAYNEGIRKLWVTNFGTLKPFEVEMSFYGDLAWETGKNDPKTDDVDLWLKNRLLKTFGGSLNEEEAGELANLMNDLDQVTNVRKVEHLDHDIFPLTGCGDEGGHRLHFYKKCFDKGNEIWNKLPRDQKDAFFELVLMKIHAAYYSNAMFYYADRSNLCMKQGKKAAAAKYTLLSLEFDRLRKDMLYYYNHVMAGGKWSGILTPEDFPPPRTACCPPCMPPLDKGERQLIVTTWSGDGKLTFNGCKTKWIEVANAGEGEISFEISAPEWLKVSCDKGRVGEERRIGIENISAGDSVGEIRVHCPDTGETLLIPTEVRIRGKEEDGRIIIEASEFEKCEGKVTVIPRLGRDHGSLVQLDDETATVTYSFETFEDIKDATLMIHRFPTLNSVGRIRAALSVDGKEPFIYEAAANDEHKANWKENVQNNGDMGTVTGLELKKGMHSLKISGIDKYFSFSRVFILTGEDCKFNTGVECYGEDLPEEYDTAEMSVKLYGKIKPEPVKEIFTTFDEVKNANTDYDAYRAGEEPVPLSKWREESLKTAELIKASAAKPLGTEFDAASALWDTKNAFIKDAEGKITYCNSLSHGGCGLGLYIREKGPRLSLENAPSLNYRFEIPKAGDYRLWLKLFMWGNDRSKFEVTIDGQHFETKDFVKPKLWSYSSENTWKWYPVCEKELSSGVHSLTLHLLDPGLRVDQIHFEKDKFIWKD